MLCDFNSLKNLLC